MGFSIMTTNIEQKFWFVKGKLQLKIEVDKDGSFNYTIYEYMFMRYNYER